MNSRHPQLIGASVRGYVHVRFISDGLKLPQRLKTSLTIIRSYVNLISCAMNNFNPSLMGMNRQLPLGGSLYYSSEGLRTNQVAAIIMASTTILSFSSKNWIALNCSGT